MYLNLPTDPYLWNPLDFFGLYGLDPLPKGKESLISVVQMNSTNDIKKNLSKIFKHLDNAKNKLSELVVFPELSLTGHLNKNKLALSSDSSEILELADYAIKMISTFVVVLLKKIKKNFIILQF